jgi:hypothetical protein
VPSTAKFDKGDLVVPIKLDPAILAIKYDGIDDIYKCLLYETGVIVGYAEARQKYVVKFFNLKGVPDRFSEWYFDDTEVVSLEDFETKHKTAIEVLFKNGREEV